MIVAITIRWFCIKNPKFFSWETRFYESFQSLLDGVWVDTGTICLNILTFMNEYIIDSFRHVINYFHKNGLYGRVNFSRVVLSKTKLHRRSANKHVLHEWIVCLGFGVVRLYRFCRDKSDELCRVQTNLAVTTLPKMAFALVLWIPIFLQYHGVTQCFWSSDVKMWINT